MKPPLSDTSQLTIIEMEVGSGERRWDDVLPHSYIIVMYERIDEDTIRVVTAYEVPEP